MSSHRILLSRAFVLGFFATLVATESAQEDSLLAPLLFFAGLVLVGAATAGRLWCSLYISGYKDSELITVGPYSMTRNPLYFFSGLGFAGVGLATETFSLALVTVLGFAGVYPLIIRREEAYLSAKFGEAFAAYCARTPRFLPRLGAFQEPGSYTVNPRLFRRTMGDVLWFVWLVALIELIEALHEHHLITPWLQLP